MTTESIINNAIKDIEQAATHAELAANLYYKAISQLRGVSTLGISKKKVVATPEEDAKFLAGLHKRMFKQKKGS